MTSASRFELPSSPQLRDGADLLLRRHRRDDLPGIYAQCQDPKIQRWTTIPNPYTHEDAEWFLDHVARGWQSATLATFAVEVDGRFAGSVSLHLQNGSWGEVGYGLDAWARGRGVMTRSVGLVLDWGFGSLGLDGAHWRAEVGNRASRRVAEKHGFRLEGTVRGLMVHRDQRVEGWIGTVLAGERPT